MKSFINILVTAAVLGLNLATSLQAVPVVRMVVGKTNMPQNAVLQDGVPLQTRAKSASEVAMDSGVVRAGSNTSLRASGRDQIRLEQGLALVASKPKFFRPAVSVETVGHRFQVKGTAQIYHEPGKALRVVVIEGRMTISLQSLSRERVTLRAGQMLVINPVEPILPEPLDIDLDRLVSTAQLLAGRQFDELPTRDLVVEATRDQEEEKKDGNSRESSAGGIRDAGDSVIYARSEELIHAELIGEIDDLDGDGELDDFGDLDDLDDDENLDDDDLNDADGDDGDDGDGDAGDTPDPGDGGGGGDE